MIELQGLLWLSAFGILLVSAVVSEWRLRRCRRRLAWCLYYSLKASRLARDTRHAESFEWAYRAWEQADAELGDSYHDYVGEALDAAIRGDD